MHEADPQRPASLFEGVAARACMLLDISSLRHRSALHALGAREDIPEGLVETIYRTVRANHDRRPAPVGRGSQETWRWFAPQTKIAAANKSPEVVLERAVVGAAVRLCRSDWSNQVPVASGLMGHSADKHCAIDLVHRIDEDSFAFIELKVASDTPLYAAVEIIGYSCAWLLARQEPARGPLPLLQARRVQLSVLAPSAFYAPFSLQPLQARLAAEVAALGDREGVALGFAFEVLDDAALAPKTLEDAALLAMFDARRAL